jgi:hypothetical protein
MDCLLRKRAHHIQLRLLKSWPAPLTATPQNINPQWTPVRAELAETLLRKDGAQRVIVVVKRRKLPGSQPIATAVTTANGGKQ